MTGEAKRSGISGPPSVLLVGIGLLIVGVLIAVGSGLVSAGLGFPTGIVHTPFGTGASNQPLGIALLVSGIAVGAGVLGYLIGARRR
ncbi:hypothetical protein [Arthrobacter sp. HLT1-21]